VNCSDSTLQNYVWNALEDIDMQKKRANDAEKMLVRYHNGVALHIHTSMQHCLRQLSDLEIAQARIVQLEKLLEIDNAKDRIW